MADSGSVKETVQAANESVEQVVGEFRDLVTKFDDLVATGTASVDVLRGLRDEAVAKVDQAKELAGQVKRGAGQKLRAAGAASSEYVHANPWSAASIAGGVGLLLGLLIARR